MNKNHRHRYIQKILPFISYGRVHIGIFLGGISLCLLIILITIYQTGSDAIALITTFPLWLCCLVFALPALIAWIWVRSRFALIIAGLWLVYGISIADFIPSMARIGLDDQELPEQPQSQQIRVCSLARIQLDNNTIQQLKRLNSDLIFIQRCNDNLHALQLANRLFDRNALVQQVGSCAIIVKHGELSLPSAINNTPGLIIDWVPKHSTMPIRLINVRLEPCQYRFDFYSPACWRYFHSLRVTHQTQIDCLFATLQQLNNQRGDLPIILVGDFSAAPHSPIFTKLDREFHDCFREKGVGYGATQPSGFPLVRADRMFCTTPLTPHKTAVIHIPGNDSLSIVADINLP